MFIPAVRSEAGVCRCSFKQDEAQEAYGGDGYERGGNDRDLLVIVRREVDDRSHEGSRGNRPCDEDNVCADDEHPIHIRRFPKLIDTVKPVDNAERDANRMVRCVPQHDACRNRDGPSKDIHCWIIAHALIPAPMLCIGSPEGGGASEVPII